MRAALILSLAGTLAMCGCGVSQELYDARGTEIEKLKREMAEADAAAKAARENEKKTCDDRIAGLEKGRKSDQIEAEKRLAELKAQADARARQFHELTEKLKAMVSSGKLKVEIRNGLMLVKLPEGILFDSGKANLKPSGKATLKELGQALAGIAGRKFQVAGHTDDKPLGHKSKYGDNWGLSTARAVEVVDFLIKDGGMKPSVLSAAGWADQLPVAKNDTDEGRQQNRRIEIVLQPNIDELPAMAGQ